ncbi:hypothetical protein MZD04_gp203 [Pseudomonas phage Psa21]|uniref:Uncharacterized protein n=1 Tax=Pseudomonas phage Psa21 TaxID=2530023 RepID=A0A481W4I3_9CAUD|nr:hypothetical protein MZD04_gp203 [Pseudomonas phage Psa21]QBJ02729.1 hypothetical protein PSA21_203 [Pseudomonas phage Psa21]
MIRRMLLSLDVLLDTRLGVIANLNSAAAKELVRTPLYWERDYDDWHKLTGGLITNEEFAEAYAKRGGENSAATLNASVETGMSPFIYQFLAEADINMIDGMTPHTDEIGLAINIAPYVMTPKERADLVDIIQLKYGRELDVKLVDYQMEELTVERLSDEFGGMIIYEFATWFKYHHVAIVGSLMSDFNVIHPKIFDVDPSELSLEEKKHNFYVFRLATQHNMDINYIDASYFSLINLRGMANATAVDDINATP